MKKKDIIKIINRDKYLYLMMLLPFVYYIIFHYVPMYGVTLAFKEFNIMKGILGSKWVGLKYVKQFLTDQYFWKVFKNTLIINIYNLFWYFPVPIILALAINELNSKKFQRVVQSITYLPHFISTVVICGMLISFLSTDGLINRILAVFNLGPYQFLIQPKYFRIIYIASNIWQGAGWSSIIYLASLSNIDTQLYEAATIDGANRWQRTRHVTIPGIMPTISILFILETGKIMDVAFQKILLLSNGSNMEVSDVIETYVYRRGILGADFSYSTGVGLFQSVIGLIFVLTSNAISRKVSEYSLW